MDTIGCLLVLLAYTASIQENYQFVTLPEGAHLHESHCTALLRRILKAAEKQIEYYQTTDGHVPVMNGLML
jgi:hypothetical protein